MRYIEDNLVVQSKFNIWCNDHKSYNSILNAFPLHWKIIK